MFNTFKIRLFDVIGWAEARGRAKEEAAHGCPERLHVIERLNQDIERVYQELNRQYEAAMAPKVNSTTVAVLLTKLQEASQEYGYLTAEIIHKPKNSHAQDVLVHNARLACQRVLDLRHEILQLTNV
jgi:hypothetical protein